MAGRQAVVRDGARALHLTQMAWVAGTSRDHQGIQLAEDQEKQARLTNHPDDRERPIQTKQSMMVWRGPMMAERKL